MSKFLRVAKVSAAQALSDDPAYPRLTRASDLRAALLDADEMDRQRPTHPKPHIMVDRLRVVGEDTLTAKDLALYELLLAWARREGVLKARYEVDGEAVRSYLRLERWADVAECVVRLGAVRVRFDVRDDIFREEGTVPLVVAHTKTLLASGVSAIAFEFPSVIRKILAGDQFAVSQLDLAPYPRFASKYGSRLYGLLAARSGHTWSVTPADLAELLGWAASPLHVGMFKKRAVMPALDDVQCHALRLDVDMTEVHGAGRGRPVESFIFSIRPAGDCPLLQEVKTLPMSAQMAERTIVGDGLHGSAWMPGIAHVGKTVRLVDPIRPFQKNIRRYRLNSDDAQAAWIHALDEARRDRVIGLRIGAPTERSVYGQKLIVLIEAEGVDAAFARFIAVEWEERRFLHEIASKRKIKRQGASIAQRDLVISHGLVEEANRPPLPLAPFKVDETVDFVPSEIELEQEIDDLSIPAVDDDWEVEPEFPGDRTFPAPVALGEADEIPF